MQRATKADTAYPIRLCVARYTQRSAARAQHSSTRSTAVLGRAGEHSAHAQHASTAIAHCTMGTRSTHTHTRAAAQQHAHAALQCSRPRTAAHAQQRTPGTRAPGAHSAAQQVHSAREHTAHVHAVLLHAALHTHSTRTRERDIVHTRCARAQRTAAHYDRDSTHPTHTLHTRCARCTHA
jgi:hypothetical protein